MADMIADLKHKVGKSMSRLSTNEPHRVPASVARYEGVFQNVLNEVHAPDIAHYVYVLQGDIVVPSGTGRKIRSVPTLTRAKPKSALPFSSCFKQSHRPLRRRTRMLHAGRAHASVPRRTRCCHPRLFRQTLKRPNNRIIDTHQAKHRVITQFEQKNAQSHNELQMRE